ncbi:hypothetical protein TSTA_024360 [Talaromyces stipitatus ATCC 10500]|uniref:Uncharacterized protein n=1 Tax=Talaromyces stipitatus (strain ATCC 10500 / CBS 375.48 / QM 6759 / NRRL 1006) TaxID=441959 RepID=B8M4B6_TALSN|nr:uncharacterized protein TSTA_024360 [Talaromyces stipitatus ATCC 10500]EED19111.1 hypothetical protein TSTA_024360 [Talaromyces stipitatus ATCC 10500]
MAIVFLSWEYYAGDNAMIHFSMVKAVMGASPLRSGVDLLSLVLSQVVASILSEGLVRKVGYYLQFVIVCGILFTISAALVSTFQADTASENNAIALAVLVFMENFGGAILIVIAETIFNSKLALEMAQYAPDVNVEVVEAAGASGFGDAVPPAQIHGVLRAYNSALTKEFTWPSVVWSQCWLPAGEWGGHQKLNVVMTTNSMTGTAE